MSARKQTNRSAAPRTRKRRGRSRPPRHVPGALLAAGIAVAMMVLALWCWGNASQIARYYETSRPDVTAWAVNAGAVATAAAAQLVVVWFVIPRLSRPGLIDRTVSLAAGFVLLTALACTVAFAAAGR